MQYFAYQHGISLYHYATANGSTLYIVNRSPGALLTLKCLVYLIDDLSRPFSVDIFCLEDGSYVLYKFVYC